MWKRVSEVVTHVRDESARVVQSFPTDELTDKVTKLAAASNEEISKLAAASNEELSRYSHYVRKESDKLSHDIESATRCQACDKYISTALAVARVKGLVKCSTCGIKCCPECIEWSKESIPDDMWHNSITEKDRPKNGRISYCKLFCRPKLVQFWLKRSCTMKRQDFFDTLELYLTHGKVEKISKPFATKDGHYRKGKRILTLAEYAANVIGYKQYVKIITYVAQGHGIFSYLLENDYVSLLYPLLELLEGFGIKGPDGLLRVWYFACRCELQRKLNNTDYESIGLVGSDSDEGSGVLSSSCPQELLDYVGSYMGPAQWLYSAMGLPHPHSSDDWTHWYLSRLVGVQGWSLLASSVTATNHYDVMCPAFALVARHRKSTVDSDSESEDHKEALLVIRGSSSVVDWNINLKDNVVNFSYWRGSGFKGEGPLQQIDGKVHEAMLDGARKILDLYGMRPCISQLLDNGFDVKVIGHSLGAATACLIAAEIKNGYALEFNQQEMEEEGIKHSLSRFSGNIPRVVAIGFGCPPCVDSSLGDAILSDDLFLSVVHRDDLVPRLTRQSLEHLADQVKEYSVEAKRLRNEDTESLKTYALTYGLAKDMGEGNCTANTNCLNNEEADDQLNSGDMGLLLVDDDDDSGDDDGKNCEKNISNGSESNTEDSRMNDCKNSSFNDDPALVVPGKIIYLYFSQGGYRATLCNYRLGAFSEIIPIQSAVRNHYMRSHIEAMRSLRLGNCFSSCERVSPPTWQPIYENKDVSDCNSPSSLKSFYNSKSCENIIWARCYVCDSDPTWPYITRSDAARGMAVHNCRSCGRVVCSVCSPSGDKIPADGIGKFQNLPDNRISLPFMGLTEKQRVCTPCFLHSYDRVSSLTCSNESSSKVLPSVNRERCDSITL